MGFLTGNYSVVAIVPALNAQGTISEVVHELKNAELDSKKIERIVVVDNGSNDQTVALAREAETSVINERLPGFGSACSRGVKEAESSDVLIIIDGDSSFLGSEWPRLVWPIVNGEADIVIGAREAVDNSDSTRAPFWERLNVALGLITLKINFPNSPSDLCTFCALRTKSILSLPSLEKQNGWALDLQLRALRAGLKLSQVSVTHRRWAFGLSKISGNFRGIPSELAIIFKLFFRELLTNLGALKPRNSKIDRGKL